MNCGHRIVFVLLFCAAACSRVSEYEPLVAQAEELMCEHPDSALVVLRQADASRIRGRELRAKYSLLLSQALDKNYFDKTDDSLINIAVSYYKPRGCSAERMKSHYYLGRIYQNAGLYQQANLNFTLAENDAERLGDHFYAGMACRAMMEVYNTSHNYKEEALYAAKAYESFAKAGAERHAAYALYDLGAANFNRQKYNEAAETFNKVIEYAEQNGETRLETKSRINLSDIYIEQEQPYKAMEQLLYIRDSLGYPLDYEWYVNYASACLIENRLDEAEAYLAKGGALIDSTSTEHEKQKYMYRAFLLDKRLGRYKSALDAYEYIVTFQTAEVRRVLEESVIAYQRDYLKEQNEFAAFRLKSHFWLSVAIFMVLVLVIVIVSRQQKLKSIQIGRYMEKICELEMHLVHNRGEINNMSVLIRRLFHDKFALVNDLCNRYYERKNTYSEQISIYEDVKKNIEKIGSNGYTSSELERIINECCDNMMGRMRAQLPNFRAADFQLISYIIAGFSYQAISVFMDTKTENLYKRVHRLRERIAASDAPDKDIFLREIAIR